MAEVYCLRLDHYIEAEGERCRLEEPLVVQMIAVAPEPVCLNRMMDVLKSEILKRAGDPYHKPIYSKDEMLQMR